jgi:hypothetical protein
MKDLFGDRRCSDAIIQFLRSTEIGRRFSERGGDNVIGYIVTQSILPSFTLPTGRPRPQPTPQKFKC